MPLSSVSSTIRGFSAVEPEVSAPAINDKRSALIELYNLTMQDKLQWVSGRFSGASTDGSRRRS